MIEALKLGQSASAIEAAVGARSWSSEAEARATAAEMFPGPDRTGAPPGEADLHAAMRAGRILAHAQGFRVMAAASEAFDWSLDLARIAEIWRAGCIIRSALLDDLADALRAEAPHGHLVMAPMMRDRLNETLPGLRRVVGYAVSNGLPAPALTAALSWFDSLTTARGTTNLIQAQRDIFGRHGFERIDAPGDKVNADWGTPPEA